ncbi:uncharacterized protein LOC134217176 [Armigeres subalbatus]|uniref:uncharacterized protein LOC134217176 n=1 Tax=Armigeres subalbatus TaxID=124917 RepID=UPI002ED14485
MNNIGRNLATLFCSVVVGIGSETVPTAISFFSSEVNGGVDKELYHLYSKYKNKMDQTAKTSTGKKVRSEKPYAMERVDLVEPRKTGLRRNKWHHRNLRRVTGERTSDLMDMDKVAQSK